MRQVASRIALPARLMGQVGRRIPLPPPRMGHAGQRIRRPEHRISLPAPRMGQLSARIGRAGTPRAPGLAFRNGSDCGPRRFSRLLPTSP